MMTFKTFSKQTTGLSGKSTRNNRERLRQEAAAFINKEIKSEKNNINITESAMIGGALAITVWYRTEG